MSINGRSLPVVGLNYGGCSCHNRKDARRSAKHSAKRAEAREPAKDVKDE
jgi:hypothetical protein